MNDWPPDEGNKPKYFGSPPALSMKDRMLIDAIESDNIDAARKAIEHGADVNALNGLPLAICASLERTQIIIELFKQGASAKLATGDIGFTPRQCAMWLNEYRENKDSRETIAKEQLSLWRDILHKILHYQEVAKDVMTVRSQLEQTEVLSDIAQALKELRDAVRDATLPHMIRKDPMTIPAPLIKKEPPNAI